eukprot:scaffold179745_cov20-Tisochrysis_lutea.AAC.2
MSVLVNSMNPTASRHKFKKDMVANTVRCVGLQHEGGAREAVVVDVSTAVVAGYYGFKHLGRKGEHLEHANPHFTFIIFASEKGRSAHPQKMPCGLDVAANPYALVMYVEFTSFQVLSLMIDGMQVMLCSMESCASLVDFAKGSEHPLGQSHAHARACAQVPGHPCRHPEAHQSVL